MGRQRQQLRAASEAQPVSDSQFQPHASQGFETLRRLFLLAGGVFMLTALTRVQLLYALPALALLLLGLAMRRLDPRRYALSAKADGLWRVHGQTVGEGCAQHELCSIANRSRLPGLLWLECRVASRHAGLRRGRPLFALLLLPADCLSQERWRALRRTLKLQGEAADSG